MIGNQGWAEMSYMKYKWKSNKDRMIDEYEKEYDNNGAYDIDEFITEFWQEEWEY